MSKSTTPLPKIDEVRRIFRKKEFLTIQELFKLSKKIGDAEAQALYVNILTAYQEIYGEDRAALVDETGMNLMCHAVNGGPRALKFMLDAGFNVNERDSIRGNTPLNIAAFEGDEDSARFLLDRGADISLTTARGDTVLMTAATFNHADLAAFFCTRVADIPSFINLKNIQQNSAVVFAASKGHVFTTKLLSKLGADTDELNDEGLDLVDSILIKLDGESDEKKRADLIEIIKFILTKAKEDVSDEAILQRQKLAVATMMLGMLYSDENFPSRRIYNVPRIVLEQLPKLEGLPKGAPLGARNADLFKQILTGIVNRDSEDFVRDDHTIVRVIRSSFKEHVSYFVVECDEENRPKFLWNIDGNAPFYQRDKSAVGCVTTKFTIDAAECPDLGTLERKLGKIKDTKQIYPRSLSKSGEASALVGIVECDATGSPIIAEEADLRKYQKRGNCEIKALQILLEFIGRLVYGVSVADRSDAAAAASYEGWHNLCKIFKDALILNNLETAVEIGKTGNQKAIALAHKVHENMERKRMDGEEERVVQGAVAKPLAASRKPRSTAV